MRQRLGLAAALLSRPRLLILDEPANGLDPAGSRHVHRVLADLAAIGTAVVLSSHRMDDLAALCSEVTLLAAGRVVFSGPVSKLAAESGHLDYRLRTSDPTGARRVAANVATIRMPSQPDPVRRQDDDTLVIRGPVSALDDLIIRLVKAGIAIREFAPVVAPLEAAFLALTGDGDETTAEDDEESR
jgi:ABC-2 type transport system ATP-binding protein